MKKQHTAYAGYNADLDRIAVHSVSGSPHVARSLMAEIYSRQTREEAWIMLKKQGWRIVKISMVLVK